MWTRKPELQFYVSRAVITLRGKIILFENFVFDIVIIINIDVNNNIDVDDINNYDIILNKKIEIIQESTEELLIKMTGNSILVKFNKIKTWKSM